MKKDDKLDEWLYRIMPEMNQKIVENMPECHDFSLETSKGHKRKMKALICRAKWVEKCQTYVGTVGRVAIACSLMIAFITGIYFLNPTVQQKRYSAKDNEQINFSYGMDIMYEVAENGIGSIVIKKNLGTSYVIESWCYGCDKKNPYDTHCVLIRGKGATQSEANLDFYRNLQVHEKLYSSHLHSTKINEVYN